MPMTYGFSKRDRGLAAHVARVATRARLCTASADGGGSFRSCLGSLGSFRPRFRRVRILLAAPLGALIGALLIERLGRRAEVSGAFAWVAVFAAAYAFALGPETRAKRLG